MTDEDEPRAVGWIDYIIASNDPADRALAAEFAANWRANHETRESILTEGPSEQTLALIELRQRETAELQTRVHARGEALASAGASPADRGVFEAWIDGILLRPTIM